MILLINLLLFGLCVLIFLAIWRRIRNEEFRETISHWRKEKLFRKTSDRSGTEYTREQMGFLLSSGLKWMAIIGLILSVKRITQSPWRDKSWSGHESDWYGPIAGYYLYLPAIGVTTIVFAILLVLGGIAYWGQGAFAQGLSRGLTNFGLRSDDKTKKPPSSLRKP